jgi:hypothetical protein
MYSGRKSWPHCDTQCASSMANSASRPRLVREVHQGEKALGQQALGRDVDQVEFVLAQPPLDFRRGGEILRGIEEGGAHAGLQQRVDLVLHQRDQRRDHDADARPQQRRDLVAQRLAAAGRHQHQRVAAADHVLDDLGLRPRKEA